MATDCGNCGAAVDPVGPGLRARGDSHLHFSGRCSGCGRNVQWHQTVIGMIEEAPLLGSSRLCPPKCKHRDPAASVLPAFDLSSTEKDSIAT